MNRIVVKIFVAMLVYSAKKNSASGSVAYSTFKPETSSDSPVNSRELLVSAGVEINHIMVNVQDGKTSYRCSWVIITFESVNDPFINSNVSRTIAGITSYEIVLLLAGLQLMPILNLRFNQIIGWRR